MFNGMDLKWNGSHVDTTIIHYLRTIPRLKAANHEQEYKTIDQEELSIISFYH